MDISLLKDTVSNFKNTSEKDGLMARLNKILVSYFGFVSEDHGVRPYCEEMLGGGNEVQIVPSRQGLTPRKWR